MSYERGRRQGRRAGKYAVVVGLAVLLAGITYNPSTPLKWFLIGGVAYFAAAIVALALIYSGMFGEVAD